MSLIQSIFGLLKSLSRLSSTPSSPKSRYKAKGTLLDLADRYEEELADRTFSYTFKPKRGRAFRADVEFERSGFCHLFSIGSIVKSTREDPDEYAGMRGWRNIQKEAITFEKLQRLDPDEFEYYAKEYEHFDELIETVFHPQAVLFDPSKVPGSKLKSDVLLYGVHGSKTVHIGLSEGNDGWFVRSFFVRDVKQDREYLTKYIHGMDPLEVSLKVKK